MKPAYVHGVGLWTPGFTDAFAWCDAESDPDAVKPGATLLEGALRRRATPLTRMGIEAMAQAVRMAGVDPGALASVWATAHGEHSTAIALLEMMQRGEGKLSPTKFHNSVHNTASGYASIAATNRSLSTTLSGGAELVASAVCEAACMLETHACDVVVVLADEPLMTPFERTDAGVPLALSMLLSSRAEGAFARLADVRRDGVARIAPHPRFGRLHVAAALPLIERIVHGTSGTTALELEEGGARGRGGEGRVWCLDLEVLAPCSRRD